MATDQGIAPGAVSDVERGEADVGDKYGKQRIDAMLDRFTKEHGIKSLHDRLRIGLNEAGVLAVDFTKKRVQDMCRAVVETDEDAETLYEDLLAMVVDIQQHGPWAYASTLTNPESPLARAWFMLNTAVTKGYEKEQDLNDAEFVEHATRIEQHLRDAASTPEEFFETAKKHVLKRASRALRHQVYKPPTDKKPEGEWKELAAAQIKAGEKGTPVGEGLGTFLPMAIEGFKAGVATDAEGWVYVGAAERIKDGLLQSCGLTKEVVPDPRDPNRTVVMYKNESGQQVVKRVHPGFLVILSRSMDLARKIAKAINDEANVLQATEAETGHLRVIQTTEAERDEWDEDKATENWDRVAFLKMPELRSLREGTAETTALARPKEDFYRGMQYVRGMHVYLDALKKARHEMKRELTEHEKNALGADIWEKQTQKVEELRYINELIDGLIDRLPPDVDTVIDMAGGAGDLGLAVGTELLARGRALRRAEIVDPQEGVAQFMEKIITWLPFRKEMESAAHHTTGYLQDAKITPESMVVAKHACGSLTDDIVEMWRDSESPILVAMTCCQDKAADNPARYGIPQAEWHRLCKASAKTNTVVPEAPGPARDMALRELKTGHEAMDALDLARVEYLRRHGFQAELHKTDKFPKGNVIIARRLPRDFMGVADGLRALERDDPKRFDGMMTRLDQMARGRKPRGSADLRFGEGWRDVDYAELIRRMTPSEEAKEEEAAQAKKKAAAEREAEIERAEAAERQAVEEKAKRLAFLGDVFSDSEGSMQKFVKDRMKGKPGNMGKVMPEIQKIIQAGGDAPEVRKRIDEKMTELGY